MHAVAVINGNVWMLKFYFILVERYSNYVSFVIIPP